MKTAALWKVAFCIFLAHAGMALAADLKVLSGFGMKAVLEDLGPQFERSSGHKLTFAYHSTGGMRRVIDAGELFDVAIVTQVMVQDLVKQAKIGTPTPIARTGVGVAVKTGTSKPTVDSAEAFKRTVLGARSIAYTDEGATAAHVANVIDRLGITKEFKAKAKPQKSGGLVGQAVADGTAELGFMVISSIRSTPGIELAGPLPAELQDWVVYSAGVGSAAKNIEGARAFVKFLTDERAAQTLRAKGMEPAAPR